MALTGCKPNTLLDRSLIFSTHTTLGLEVSVDPTDSAGAATIVIGYRRSEGVLNPVFYNHSPDGASSSAKKSADDYYLDDAFSVIAKFEGSASGNAAQTAAGKTVLSQWFATGEAAKILARYGGAIALSDNPAVANAVAESLSLGAIHRPASLTRRTVLQLAYDEVKEASTNEQIPASLRAEATAVMAALDTAEVIGLIPTLTQAYSVDRSVDGVLQLMPDVLPIAAPTDFPGVLVHMDTLSESASELQLAYEDAAADPDNTTIRGPSGKELQKEDLYKLAEAYSLALEDIQKQVFADPSVIRLLSLVAGAHAPEK